VSLRAHPIVEHATLPGGGTIAVWVGVPEDSYVAAAELTTVDLQLHEGDNVLASVTTVLEPSQDSEARQLAREVRSAIEAGDIALTAAALEPFADRLR
jgi:hypothetical protein